jgi:hypothetical protein
MFGFGGKGRAPDPTGWDWPRAVTIYDLPQARLAATTAQGLGRGISFLSAPFAAADVGVGWMVTLGKLIGEDFPDLPKKLILDCGTAGGRALGALQGGALDAVIFSGSRETFYKLADVADEKGIRLIDTRPLSLDLLDQPDGRLTGLIEDWLLA